ncbi:MAG: DUF3618 domain-containing protein [Armatimonadetes bacterium]|nr:DUF3618 domain-containing protein [Armatimonadota bacterium]
MAENRDDMYVNRALDHTPSDTPVDPLARPLPEDSGDSTIDLKAVGDAATEEEIERTREEIEVTRTEISETVDALKEKLSPSHLMQEAKESLHDATVGRAQETAEHVMDKTREAMGVAQVKAQETWGTTQEKAQEVWGTTQETVRQTSSNLPAAVRQNPLPAILAGVGIGWMIWNAYQEGSQQRSSGGQQGTSRTSLPHESYGTQNYPYRAADLSTPPPPGSTAFPPGAAAPGTVPHAGEFSSGGTSEGGTDAMGQLQDMAHQAQGRTTDMVHQARDAAGQVTGQVQEKAGQVVDQAGQMAGQVRERAGEIVHQVQDRASELASQARTQAATATDSLQRMIDQNPVAVAAATAALGVVVGYLVPETKPEHRIMGETGGQIVEKARDTAQEVTQKVQHVAQHAMDTVKQQAQEVSTQVTDQVKEAVTETKDELKKTVEEEGLTAQGVKETVKGKASSGSSQGKSSKASGKSSGSSKKDQEDLFTTGSDQVVATDSSSLPIGDEANLRTDINPTNEGSGTLLDDEELEEEGSVADAAHASPSTSDKGPAA